ncbi:MAG: SRPBCC domain-containing protein [Ignavibacteria bacterium]|jgi:uncharacterized protein YndB with AHSA1/START domain
MASIKHYLIIKAPVEKVYQSILTTEGLRGWWTDDAYAEEKVGGIAEFNFDEAYHNEMRITKLEKNKLIEWECIEGDKEWIGTYFRFEFESRDDDTILRFTHGDWREETDFFASCNYHWGYYLSSLKKYNETGEGTPFISKK